MSAPHHTTATTTHEAKEQATAREFIAGLKYRYHHYEHTNAAVETEIREIMAGRRKKIRRLTILIQRRDESLEALQLYLTTIIHRLKDGDPRLAEHLHQKFGTLNEKVYIPLDTTPEDDE